jgi:hypothetical protein
MTTRLSDAQLRALTLAARPAGVTRSRDLLTGVDVAQVTLDSLRRAGLIVSAGGRWTATTSGAALLDGLPHDERVAAIARAETLAAERSRERELASQLAAVCKTASVYVDPPLSADSVRAELRKCRTRTMHSLATARQMVVDYEQAIAALDAASADLAALLTTTTEPR